MVLFKSTNLTINNGLTQIIRKSLLTTYSQVIHICASSKHILLLISEKFGSVSFYTIFEIETITMNINTQALRNKQRIYIGGNHGAKSIFKIIKHVLTTIGKPADFFTYGEDSEITNAPIIIMRGADALIDGKAVFHDLKPHMLLVHKIKDDVPDGYASFDEYISQIELLADNLPKAGSLFFYEEDAVGILMGKKERADVRETPYGELPSQTTQNGFEIEFEGAKISVSTNKANFPKHSAGAKALLNRIGVSDTQFFNSIKTLS